MFATSDFFFLFFLGFVLTLIISIAAFLLIRSCKFCWQTSCDNNKTGFTHNNAQPIPFIIFVPPPSYAKGHLNLNSSSGQRPIGAGYYTGPPSFAGPQPLQVPSVIDTSHFGQEYLPGGFYMTLIEDECYGGPPGSCQAFKIVPATVGVHEGPDNVTDFSGSSTLSHDSDFSAGTPETLSTSDSYGMSSVGGDDMANFV